MHCTSQAEAALLPNGAVHVGRREHYRLARELVAREPERVVLMQRSSTLLLGPEDGWDREAEFYDEVWRSVAAGTRWFHVASLRGIERHLERRGSSFPHAGSGSAHIVDHNGTVTIRSAVGTLLVDQSIKVLPEEGSSRLGDDFSCDDYKFDRQIRLVAADFGDHSEALVVSDIGDRQVTIHVAGNAAAVLLEACIDFYRRCPPLNVDDLARCRTRAEAGAPLHTEAMA